MTAFRPNASDSVPAESIRDPNSPVAADNESVAAAGEIEKPRAKPGIIGWTRTAKVARPPRKRATLTRQNRASPRDHRWTGVGDGET